MMNNQRYNSFNQIHKGLRTLLYDTSLQLQRTDLSDYESGAKVLKQITEVLYLFDGHANSEDNFFNKPIEELEPSVSQLFLEEHKEDHRLGHELESLSKSWYAANSNEERYRIGQDLTYSFHEFTAFNLYHMNKEERQLNAVLWKHYSDEQIKATEQELVRSVPPEKMASYAKWMVRGINDTELEKWVVEVRQTAPQPVLDLLQATTQKELPADRYNRLMEKLQHVTEEP